MEKTYKSKFSHLISLITEEKHFFRKIALLSVITGILSLAVPLGIQLLLTFITAQEIRLSTLFILAIMVLMVLANGWLQIVIMKEAEQAEKRLFAQFAFTYLFRILNQDPKSNARNFAKYFIEIASIQKGFSKLLIELMLTLLQLIFALILISLYHFVFLAFSLLLVVSLFFLFRYNFNKAMSSSYEESSWKYDLVDWLNLNELFRSTFNRDNQKLSFEKASHISENYLRAKDQHFSVLIKKQYAFLAFKVIAVALMLISGTYLAVEQRISIGQFLATEIVIVLVISNLDKLLLSLASLFDVLTSIQKMHSFESNALIDSKNEIPKIQVTNIENIKLKTEQQTFEFTRGNFYDIDNTTADISCLLSCLDHPLASDQIQINNTEINVIDLPSLRQNMAWIDNNTVILSESIYLNLKWTSEASTESIVKAQDLFGFHHFLDEQGLTLSDKTHHRKSCWTLETKTRLQLVRAKIQDPQVLIIQNEFVNRSSELQSEIKHAFPSSIIFFAHPKRAEH